MWMRAVKLGVLLLAAWAIDSVVDALSHPWLLALFIVAVAVPLYGSISNFRERSRARRSTRARGGQLAG